MKWIKLLMVVEYDWYILHAMQYINVSEYAKCIFWVCGWANSKNWNYQKVLYAREGWLANELPF